MKRFLLTALLFSLGASGCSKHDCNLEGEAEAKFGTVAPMTKGAFSCMVSNDTLIAAHGDSTVEGVEEKYTAYAKEQGWTVAGEEYASKRANGKPLKGRMLKMDAGGTKTATIIYELSDQLVETNTAVE